MVRQLGRLAALPWDHGKYADRRAAPELADLGAKLLEAHLIALVVDRRVELGD